jgi:hypothetical protein
MAAPRKFEHHAIKSPVFELIRVFEFDMDLGEDSFYPTRVELYRAGKPDDLYRCRVWQVEHYRIQSTFPQAEDGTHLHEPSDEEILVEYSAYLRCDWDPAGFRASSPEAARQMVEEALLAFLDHTTVRPD